VLFFFFFPRGPIRALVPSARRKPEVGPRAPRPMRDADGRCAMRAAESESRAIFHMPTLKMNTTCVSFGLAV
jgi:hypothetical protein